MSIMEVEEEASSVSPQIKSCENDSPEKNRPPCQITLLDLINKTFTNNLKILCNKYNLTESSLIDKSNSKFSFWILNNVFIPLNHLQNNSFDLDGLINIRYLDCENYRSHFVNSELDFPCECFDFDPQNEFLSFDLLNQIESKVTLDVTKLHVNCLYAFDHTGRVSCPLITFPNTDRLDTSDRLHLIKNTTVTHETQNGDLTSIDFFIDWLDLFIKQNDDENPKILFIDKFMMLKLKTLMDLDIFASIKTRLKDNNILFLFFPFESKLNSSCLSKFNELWNKNLIEQFQKDNPNNEITFIYLLKQTLRQLGQQFKNQAFNLLIEENCLEFSKFSFETVVEVEQESVDSEVKMNELNDTEIDEYCEWIDKMSRIGSLCIKYTYLRDLYNRTKSDSVNKKETLCREKCWTDFVTKNRDKFKYLNSLGILSESEYLEKSINVDTWRHKYSNLVLNELKLAKPDFLWNFEIIQFPFNCTSFMLKHPEKDLDRPKNNKSRISVLFAYSASGDYVQPFFVYPPVFPDDNNELGNNEIFSPNGFVTPKIFTHWLFKFLLPYIGDNQSKILLLFCAKLAIIDKNLIISMNESLKDKLSLFGIPSDTLKPFNMLFTKNLRNRPTDLFLDSWRKVTAKLKLSYQFKCKSRQQFFNLFMDTFQNCIEEIGNGDLNGSLNTSSVGLFRDKMISTFENCKLWPCEVVESEKLEKIEPSPKRKKLENDKIKIKPDENKQNGVEQSIKSLLKSQICSFMDSKSKVLKNKTDNNKMYDLVRDLIILLIEKKSSETTNENENSEDSLETRLESISKNGTNKLDVMRKLFDELNVKNEYGIADKLCNVLCELYQF